MPQTPLHALHLELRARMAPFAGYAYFTNDAGGLPDDLMVGASECQTVSSPPSRPSRPCLGGR